jgi:hypothetical protein
MGDFRLSLPGLIYIIYYQPSDEFDRAAKKEPLGGHQKVPGGVCHPDLSQTQPPGGHIIGNDPDLNFE